MGKIPLLALPGGVRQKLSSQQVWHYQSSFPSSLPAAECRRLGRSGGIAEPRWHHLRRKVDQKNGRNWWEKKHLFNRLGGFVEYLNSGNVFFWKKQHFLFTRCLDATFPWDVLFNSAQKKNIGSMGRTVYLPTMHFGIKQNTHQNVGKNVPVVPWYGPHRIPAEAWWIQRVFVTM